MKTLTEEQQYDLARHAADESQITNGSSTAKVYL